MTVSDYTPNYLLGIIDYNSNPWHEDAYRNYRILDAVLASTAGVITLDGVWDNSTSYTVGQNIADLDEGVVYTCAVNHTSASSGSFEADRTANPTYWDPPGIPVMHSHVIGDVTGLAAALAAKSDSSHSHNANEIVNVPAGDIAATNVQDALDELDTEKLATTLKGSNSGLAELDSGGKVPVAQLPDSIVGQLEYQATWNANTNNPTIPSAASGNKGHYYVVATAGSTNIDGETDWQIGDWLVSNGSTWDKIDNSDKVSSVAGKTGVVTLEADDLTDAATIPRTDEAEIITAAWEFELEQLLQNVASATTPATGHAKLYSKDVGGESQLFAKTDGGNEHQLSNLNVGLLQTASTFKTDTSSSTTQDTWEDISSLQITFTPTNASSTIIGIATVHVANASTGSAGLSFVRVTADGSAIHDADSPGSRASVLGASRVFTTDDDLATIAIVFSITPGSASAIDFQVEWYGTTTLARYVNRSVNDTNDANHARGVSSLVLFEVAV